MNNLRPERGGRDGSTWLACWTDDDGRRHRKSFKQLGYTVKSKAAGRKACADMIKKAAVKGNEFSVAGKAPSVLARLRTHLKQKTTYSAATQKLYRQAVSELTTWRRDGITKVEELEHQIELGKDGNTQAKRTIRGLTRMDSITREDAAKFRRHLAKTKGEATLRKIIRTLKTLWSEAIDIDLIAKNPWDRQPVSTPEVDKEWPYTSIEELHAILDACPDSAWRAFFATARLAGPRLNELCRIDMNRDIDWDKREFKVINPRRLQTTKHRVRYVPIVPELYEVLRERFELAEPGETLVRMSHASFNGSLGPSRLAMEEILKRAGTPHALPNFLRKSRETDWLNEFPAPDVCKWLGNSVTVAMKYYHKTTDKMLAQVTGRNDLERIAELEAELEMLRERAGVTTR